MASLLLQHSWRTVALLHPGQEQVLLLLFCFLHAFYFFHSYSDFSPPALNLLEQGEAQYGVARTLARELTALGIEVPTISCLLLPTSYVLFPTSLFPPYFLLLTYLPTSSCLQVKVQRGWEEMYHHGVSENNFFRQVLAS